MTRPDSARFPANARAALDDARLQQALARVPAGFIGRRAAARAELPEFDAIRDAARDMKDHTLDHLDLYLEQFETAATAAGSKVHWAADAAAARRMIIEICQTAGATLLTKGKSMVAEEIDLNAALADAGIAPVETDLGEYIIQLRDEAPSHLIAPAIHVTRQQVEEAFRAAHRDRDPGRNLTDPRALLAEAREELREQYFRAEVGLVGANFIVAETGQAGLVTNEGNGDLTQNLARVQIILVGIEKIVPTLEDATAQLRLLARSATGQEMSAYTSLSRGPRRAGDPDGPEECHVVLLDNGRSALLASEFREALRCIRCGACLNHCPVYKAIGGHAYGSTYSGPIGAVVSPGLFGLRATAHLPNASTLCGRCEEVCPVRIPLPRLMRTWRNREHSGRLSPATARAGLGAWAWLARRPRLYRLVTGLIVRGAGLAGLRNRSARRLPGAGSWTRHRDLPLPEGRTFFQELAARKEVLPE